ncbi:MAG: methyltransferase domain-containing protein [Verrucomicrobiota bacterium]
MAGRPRARGRTRDAFGQGLKAFLAGDPEQEIVEREDGHIDAVPHELYFQSSRYWQPHTRQAMRLVKGRVLDIGCGAGRHSLYLQKNGFRVTGIDVSPLAIEVCRSRGLCDARLCSITRIGPRLGRFDTIIMMGNNFGLFGSFRRARWVLRRMKAITSDRARIIAEVTDPYGTKNPCHLAYHRMNRRRGRMSGQIRLRVRFRQHATPWIDYLLASREEVRDIVRGTGWRIRAFVPPRGARYVVVLEKEHSRLG